MGINEEQNIKPAEESYVEESEPITLQDSETEIEIDPDKLERHMQKMRNNQSLSKGIIAGLLASLLGACIWAGITVATEYQIGYMAIAVGFLVGFAVKFFGKGIDKVFGFIGAAFSLFGCVLGNLFTVIVFVSMSENVPILELVMNLDINIIIGVITETFESMDVLFYGIAIYEGYRFSLNSISEKDYPELVKDQSM